MSTDTLMDREAISAAAYEVEAPVAATARPGAPSTNMRTGRDASAPTASTADRGATIAPDSVDEFVPWLPIVVPLLGAMMACDSFLIGWAVLVRR